jgi:hypothetical protein
MEGQIYPLMKKVSWSPGGEWLLGTHEQRHGWSLYSLEECDYDDDVLLHKLTQRKKGLTCGPVRDVVWHPYYQKNYNYGSYAVLIRDLPIQLWKCGQDSHGDFKSEHTTCYFAGHSKEDPHYRDPISIDFRQDGAVLAAGGKNSIYYWDINQPGVILGSWSVKAAGLGQSDISSIHWAYNLANVLCCGSFNGGISLWDFRSPISCIRSSQVSESKYQAIMHLLSYGSWDLFSSHRNSECILQWDIRSMNHPIQYLKSDNSFVPSQQRIYFDMTKHSQDTLLLSGSPNGSVYTFPIRPMDQTNDTIVKPMHITNPPISIASIPAISCHPTLPIYAIGSGNRKPGPCARSTSESVKIHQIHIHPRCA